MALWALKHACDVNPGGIKEPIKIAVMEKKGSSYQAALLSDPEHAEANDMVGAATQHFAKYRDVLRGESSEAAPPPTAA